MDTKPISKKNECGISIKKCCASCQHRVMDCEKGCRTCGLTGEPVEAKSCCSGWVMNERLMQAGRRRGKVKKPEYLKYVCDERKAGSEASVSQLRENYEKKNGTIYYNV